ncbi:hypothetical protein D3C78_1251580 [compost metagenome]
MQLFAVNLGVRLFAQVLHAALERQAGLAGLFLLQGVLAEIVEKLNVQQHQNMANLADPAFGFVGRQEAIVGRPRHLAMQGLEQKAYVLGLGFGLDRRWRVIDRDGFALCDQGRQFIDTGFQAGAGFIQIQHTLADIELQPGQQQFERRGHQLPGEGLGNFATTAQAVVEFDLGAGLFQFIVFHHMVHVANGDQ